MGQVVRAAESFFEHLAAVEWRWVALALLLHVAKGLARTRSWRNVIAAAYPDAEVRWRSVYGAYAAGVGVNALVPVRGGDVLKLFLVKRRVEGATYPTLGSTLLVETIFDAAFSSALIVWALTAGVLPGLDVIPRLPNIDWFWLFEHPRVALAVISALVLGAFLAGVWAARRIEEFWVRVAQGFAVLHPPERYLRRVIPWQTLDWTLRLATVYCFLRAFGIAADVENALRVQVTQSLSTILPITPAGIGTEQALSVYVLRGEASTTALVSFSVGLRLVLVAANVAIGFTAIALMLRTLRWRRLVEPAAEAEPS